ncbi:hypothetical protein CEXT_401421 [Caerostris extrusa]|uniref:Uncharacterized protein n=1 Tax=Caerostris extrusa TaxID=172846 RepID=A0AAV4PSA6_CAEEX|nr:hypothetical protein CEXT_401421 [Caerostris extrusa]
MYLPWDTPPPTPSEVRNPLSHPSFPIHGRPRLHCRQMMSQSEMVKSMPKRERERREGTGGALIESLSLKERGGGRLMMCPKENFSGKGEV